MPSTITKRSIDMDFIEKVGTISGEAFKTCMQCGTCSTVCPMQESTEVTPRKIIHLAQWGIFSTVMSVNMAWMCASCHTCAVRCPRGIDIPKVVEAIRLLTLRKNKNFVEPFEIVKEQIEEMPQAAMVSTFRKHTA
ncbi:4Fe-4S dicluster domain-containing protein [bacterium]|nr:4Fe-4S dicluster domain-containing protein [bacterium]